MLWLGYNVTGRKEETGHPNPEAAGGPTSRASYIPREMGRGAKYRPGRVGADLSALSDQTVKSDK